MSHLENRKRDIASLDSLRAFAALAVCLYHFVCKTIGFIPENKIYDFFFSGQYGVHLFFVISGFVIPWSMFYNNYGIKNFFRFLLKRLARLEPPYLLSIVLAIVIIYARAYFVGKGDLHIDVSWIQILHHIGYLIPFFDDVHSWLSPVYWTLAIEFQYYFLIALIFYPLIRFGWIVRVVIYIAFGVWSYFSKHTFLPFWLPIFLIGVLLFLYKTEIIKKPEYLITTLVMLVLCWDKYPHASLFFILLPVFFVLFFPQKKIKVFHFLGKMSYSIYIIHSLIGISMMNILSHHTHSVGMKIGAVLMTLVVTLFSSYLFYRWVEKPSKVLSASIKYTV